MKTPTSRAAVFVAACLVAACALSGCSTTGGRPAPPLTVARDEPGVLVCESARSAGGGLRLVARVNPGIYPIRGAVLEYRLAGPSEEAPATPVDGGRDLELTSARSEKVSYRKGAGEIVYTIGADAAQALDGKVLWYRWTLAYDNGSRERRARTAIHRTSLEEAGLPRDPGVPGPDASIALPGAGRR